MSGDRPALVLGYGFDRQDFVTPDLIGRLNISAAYEMYKAGEIDKVVFTAGRVNITNPGVGESMHSYMQATHPDFPLEDLVLDPEPDGSNSRYELKRFKKLIERYGWNHARVIYHTTHRQRVDRNVKRIFGKERPSLISAYDFLSQPEYIDKYLQDRRSLNVSDDVMEFGFRELERNYFDPIPVIGPLLFDFLAKAVPNRGELFAQVGRFRDRWRGIGRKVPLRQPGLS